MSQRDDLIAGRYRLLDHIGSGGMGFVWRARDERRGRDVAVKQLRADGVAGPEEADVSRQRVRREGEIATRVRHQHAVPVLDVVDHEGQPYLIMEYVPSRSLQEIVVERGTLPPAEVARIGYELASALAAAHRAGIVHRDVTPANVLIARDGRSRITDFGIAHRLDETTLVATGMIIGTPAYMAPEVVRGDRSTPATDVFALGATLYRAIEGHSPFPMRNNPSAYLQQVAAGAITAPERSAHLTPLLLRMLATEPAERPPMEEVARTLRRSGERRDTFHRARPVLASLALAAVAVVAVLGLQARPDQAQDLVGSVAVGAGAVGSEAVGSEAVAPAPAPTPTPPAEVIPVVEKAEEVVELVQEQAERAISDYYGLLPDDRDAGWDRLSERYRQTTAGSRAFYESFWGDIDDVTVSEVEGSATGTATATVTYRFADGRTFVERTSYGLVADGGLLKIDQSDVLSSRQR